MLVTSAGINDILKLMATREEASKTLKELADTEGNVASLTKTIDTSSGSTRKTSEEIASRRMAKACESATKTALEMPVKI